MPSDQMEQGSNLRQNGIEHHAKLICNLNTSRLLSSSSFFSIAFGLTYSLHSLPKGRNPVHVSFGIICPRETQQQESLVAVPNLFHSRLLYSIIGCCEVVWSSFGELTRIFNCPCFKWKGGGKIIEKDFSSTLRVDCRDSTINRLLPSTFFVFSLVLVASTKRNAARYLDWRLRTSIIFWREWYYLYYLSRHLNVSLTSFLCSLPISSKIRLWKWLVYFTVLVSH